MSEALRVDVVETHEHLLKVVFANCLIERTGVCNIVKEFSARNHLLGNVCDFNSGAVPLVHGCALSEFEILDDVLMAKLSRGFNFLPEKI